MTRLRSNCLLRACGWAVVVVALWLASADGVVAPAAASSRPVIFLHYWTDDLSAGVDAMVQSIHDQQQPWNLQSQGFEHESFKTGIRAMLQDHHAPDLFSYWAGQRTQMLADLNLLAPAEDVWIDHHLDDVFSSQLREACTYNGKRYGVPVTMHWVGFFYDKALFRSLNLTPPTTWSEFLVVCDTIKRQGRAPIALGLQGRWPAQFWFDYLLVRTAGPTFRDDLLQGRQSFLNPKVRRAFTLWRELQDREYFLPQAALYDWAGAVKSVYNGEAGMTLMGSWAIGMLEQKLGWKGGQEYDVFPFPVIDAGVPAVNIGPVDLVLMSRHGTHPDGPAALAAFADTRAQQAMSRGAGALAPSRFVTSDWYTPVQQRILEFVRQGETWSFAFDLAAPEPLARAGLQAFTDYHLRRRNLEEVLQAMQQVVRQ